MKYLHCTHLTGHIRVQHVTDMLTYWSLEKSTPHHIKSYITQPAWVKTAPCSSFQSYCSATRFWPGETLVLQYTAFVPTECYSQLSESLLVLTRLWEIGDAFLKVFQCEKEHQLITLTLKLNALLVC